MGASLFLALKIINAVAKVQNNNWALVLIQRVFIKISAFSK